MFFSRKPLMSYLMPGSRSKSSSSNILGVGGGANEAATTAATTTAATTKGMLRGTYLISQFILKFFFNDYQ